jgi:glucokinase
MMEVVGIQMTRGGARAVRVDQQGAVLAWSAVDAVDASSAATDAFDQVATVGIVSAIGVAVDALDDLGAAAAPLARVLADRASDGAVKVVNAGAAAVTAEAWTGAAQGARHAVSLWIGETVFAGVLFDGHPWLGSHGLAGSAAWLALNPVERQDYRKLGGLAAEVSTRGIARRLAWRIQAGDSSSVLERAGDLEAITATHVFEEARAGDGVSISVVRDTAKYIGMAVANLASVIDPDVVVISGPLASAGDVLLGPIRQECARWLSPAFTDQLRCEISPLGEDAVAIGAARLAMPTANPAIPG